MQLSQHIFKFKLGENFTANAYLQNPGCLGVMCLSCLHAAWWRGTLRILVMETVAWRRWWWRKYWCWRWWRWRPWWGKWVWWWGEEDRHLVEKTMVVIRSPITATHLEGISYYILSYYSYIYHDIYHFARVVIRSPITTTHLEARGWNFITISLLI